MARRKVEDDVLFMLFRLTPWWVSLPIVTTTLVVLRFIVPLLLGSHSPFTSLFVIYGPYVALLMAFYAIVAEAAKWQRRKLLDQQASLDDVRRMAWQPFELLVGEAYRRQGYTVAETGGGGADGGIDLVLHRDGQRVIVQCKQWRTKQVGVSPVRELLGVVAREKATRGIFVTSGNYTNQAITEAEGQPLDLVDGSALLKLIQDVQTKAPEPRGETANARPVASAIAVVDQAQALNGTSEPLCPKCGGPMRRKRARQGPNAGNEFWGCSAYPGCRGTRDL